MIEKYEIYLGWDGLKIGIIMWYLFLNKFKLNIFFDSYNLQIESWKSISVNLNILVSSN